MGKKMQPIGPRTAAPLGADLRAYLASQRDWVIDTLCRLIAYPSLSGKEAEVMGFVEELLRPLSGELLRIPVPDALRSDPDYVAPPDPQPYDERPNLVHVRPGREQGRSLILCGHTDVVPADWPEAFSPTLDGDLILGRGASDDKGPALVAILALRALDALGIELAGPLETQLVVEEEVGGNGALALITAGRRADGVVVLESSNLDIHPAGRGALWFRVDVDGRSTHMAFVREGVSAAKEAIKIIQALERYEERLLASSRDEPLFARYEQPVMVNVGMVSSGDWPATVPAHATIEGGVGFLPNRNLEIVRQEVRAALLDGTGDWVRDHHRVSFERLRNEAYEIPVDHPLVQAFQAAASGAGLDSEVYGMMASCDARLYYHRGAMPTVVFGPGRIRHAHSRIEQVAVSDILRAAEALVHLTWQWCGWVSHD
jgi:acetylornithine deacetylase